MLGLGLSSAALGQAGNWTAAHASTVISQPQSEFTVHNYGTIHIVRSDQEAGTNSSSATQSQSATPATVATSSVNDKAAVATNSSSTEPVKQVTSTANNLASGTTNTVTTGTTEANSSTSTAVKGYQPVIVDHQQVIPQAHPASDSPSIIPAKTTDHHSSRADETATANLKAVKVTDRVGEHTPINLRQVTPAEHLATVVHNQAILVGSGESQNVVTVTSRGTRFTNLATQLNNLFAPATSPSNYPTRLSLLYRTVTVNAHGQTVPGDFIGQVNLNYAFTPQLAIDQLVQQLIPDNYQLIRGPFSLPTTVSLSSTGQVSLGTTIFVVPQNEN